MNFLSRLFEPKQTPKHLQALTTEQIKLTLNNFVSCVEHVKKQLSTEDVKEVDKWINSEALMIAPIVSLRADSLEAINNSIFTNEIVIQFITDLSFRFFTICNESDNFLHQLCKSLENGFYIDQTNLSIIPKSTRVNFAASIVEGYKYDLVSFLKANKHLILVFLFSLAFVLTDNEITE